MNSRADDDLRTVVVTGAAGGMGRTLCRRLAELGWQILALDHNAGRLEALQQQAGIEGLCCELDAPSLIDEVMARITRLPPVWGLVNLVGVSRGDDVLKLSQADWDDAFAVNVRPAFRLTQALAPLMAQAGGGSIVNVGSPVGQTGARKPNYAASKAALQGLTMSCARNLGRQGIRVNLLLPGPTITEMTRDWSAEKRQSIAESSFLGRLALPEETADGVAFLLSEQSRAMTASTLDMTAGSMWGH